MNKILVIALIAVCLSCNDRKTDLIISEKKQEASHSVNNSNGSKVEKKPLIQISKEDTLEIWVRADGAPGMYLDEKNQLKGFYVDLEKEIMKEMGQKYNFNSYTDLGPLIQKAKSGTAHSILSTPDVPDFRTLGNLSDSFEVQNFVIFVKGSYNDFIPETRDETIKLLYGKKVGVQTRGHVYQVLRDHKDIEIVEYPTTTKALEALSKGEVDAVPDINRIGKYYSAINNWDIKPIGAPIFSLNICTGFSKALDYSVVERYNKALNTLIENGTVEKMFGSYYGK